MTGMKQNILFLLVIGIALCGCKSGNNVSVVDNDYVEYAACADADAQTVRYSMPNGNDLVLETAHHVIQIDAPPGVKYDYYVWTGNRSYSDDPDLIVQDGVAAVLVEE